MVAGRISGIAARAGVFLILATVLLRAIIPGGFMPTLDPHSGKIAVVMCAATPGHEIAYLDLPDGKKDKDDAGLADGGCPFAPCGGAVLTDPCGVLEAAPAVYAYEFERRRAQPPHPQSVLRASAPPTGPPALV